MAASTAFSVPETVAYGQITTPVTSEVSTLASNKAQNTKLATASAVAINVGETEAAVRAYFADIPVMIQIARCESTFRHYLADGSVLSGRVDSADTGVMQINKRFHQSKAIQLGLNLDNLNDNMAYARHLYETQGTRPWNASANCWTNTLALN